MRCQTATPEAMDSGDPSGSKMPLRRERGVFPLPLPSLDQFCASEGCLKTRRKHLFQKHVNAWVRDMVVSLNSMYSGKEFVANFDFNPPSVAQTLCLNRLRDAVVRLGKPPIDVTGQGALTELQADFGYSGEPASLAGFQEDLVSLPPVGGTPSELSAIVGPRAENILEILRHKSLSFGEVSARKGESSLKRPYFDPALKRSKASYVKFVQRLHASNLVEFRTEAREHVGIFFVWEKSGKQRMIVDARLSNMWFGAPEKVELATGTAFSQIEVDQGPPIEVAGVDIADCFYNIGLPNEFRDLFALPPLRFGDLGLSALDFPQFDGKTQVFPCFKVVPMGFTHALWICQRCHLEIVDSMRNCPKHLRFVDNWPVPLLEPFIHTEYVDNFVALSQKSGVAGQVASAVGEEFNARGLPTHEVECSVGGDTLGWSFCEDRPSA